MAKVVCIQCRHFQSQQMLPAAWCHSPNATTIDRIHGDQHPRLYPALSMEDEKSIKAITDRCDTEGWFQERKPWWVF